MKLALLFTVIASAIGCTTTASGGSEAADLVERCSGDACGIAAFGMARPDGKVHSVEAADQAYAKGCTGRALECYSVLRKVAKDDKTMKLVTDVSVGLARRACKNGDKAACDAVPKIQSGEVSERTATETPKAGSETLNDRDTWTDAAKKIADDCIRKADGSKDAEVTLENCRLDLMYRCDRYPNLQDAEKNVCNDAYISEARRVDKAKEAARARRQMAEAEQGRKAEAKAKKLSDMGCLLLGQFYVTQKLGSHEYEIQKANIRRFGNDMTLVESIAILQTVKTEFRSNGAAGGFGVKKIGTRKVTDKNGFDHTISTYAESDKCEKAIRDVFAH